MPRTIVLEDGSQMEVPTDEELTTLKTKAQQADESTTKLTAMQQELERIKNDPIEKNWRLIREKNEKLVQELQKQGKTVSEDGTIVEAPKSLTPEEIEAKARKAAREEMLSSQKIAALSKYGDDKRKVVEHYFNKLTTGEEVTAENIGKFMQEAEILADPTSVKGNNVKHVSPNGQPPRFSPENGGGFADSDDGKKIADEVFGGLSYTKGKK